MHSLESNANIPTFILKLWKLVCDDSSNDLIQWNRNGRSFIINDQARFAKEILPLYFKHSNMASFIRQLNMYGFRKVSNIEQGGLKSDADGIEFFHPYFSLGQEDQLQFIKRKMSNNSKAITSIVKVDEIQDILSDVESIKGRQDSVDSLLNNLKQENEALWREIAILRQKHHKQQQIVEKLLQFLVSIVQNRVVGGIKRKASLLIDPGVSNNRKIIKPNKDTNNAICIASSSSSAASTGGPIIHDITDLEETGSLVSNSPSGSLMELPISSLDNGQDDKRLNKQQQQLNDSTSSDLSDKDFKDTLIAIPDNILDLELNQQQPAQPANQLTDGQQPQHLSYNPAAGRAANSILNTPRVSHYEELDGAGANTAIGNSEMVKNAANETFSTDLIPKQKSPGQSVTGNLTKLSSENFTDHVEGIESELSWLQDQLYGGQLNIDPSTILGLFGSDNQFDGLDTSSAAAAAKAIMDGGADAVDNKLIKVEDSNDSTNLFDGLDLGCIGNDTKGFLEFVDDVGEES